MRRSTSRAIGTAVLGLWLAMIIAASAVAPYPSHQQFHDWLNAPPTAIHLRNTEGRWQTPFIYRVVRVSQLEQRYEPTREPVPLAWFRDGSLVQSSDMTAPLFLLGTDSQGRDVFSRLLFGARTSLALAGLSAAFAIGLGALVGAVAGYRGGVIDECLMRSSDAILVLPGMYVALVLRTLLPVILSAPDVFLLLTAIFTVMGFPIVARGVRGLIRAEREESYVVAAQSLGAGSWRVLVRHLVPSTLPFLAVQATLLVPAFVIAEATFSYVGLGFPDTEATWGTMLHEGSSARALADFPWLLSPVVAMFFVVLALHLVGRRTDPSSDRPLAF